MAGAKEDEIVSPITLYFALEEGQRADLEVAARAAISFAEAVKELALLFDPMAEVRVELESGTQSSLGLNALVRCIKGFAGKHPGWTAFLGSLLLQVSGDVRAWTVGEVLDLFKGKDAPTELHALPDADRLAIATEIVRQLRHPAARDATRQLFREVQKDPAIVGVGVTTVRGKRPDVIVHRYDFPRASGDEISDVEPDQTRRVVEDVRATLKRPRLEAVPSSWRFQVGTLPEFSAEMRDKSFLQAWAERRIRIPMDIGLEMVLELESEQSFEGGVWVTKKRSVTRVLSPPADPGGLGLFAPD